MQKTLFPFLFLFVVFFLFLTGRAAWREAHGNSLQLRIAFLGQAARASVRCELAEEAQDYAEEGMVQAMRELPELRDAMSLV